jgi:hypothetical protein
MKQVEKRTYRGHKKMRIIMREKRMVVLEPAGEVEHRHGIECEKWKTSLTNG